MTLHIPSWRVKTSVVQRFTAEASNPCAGATTELFDTTVQRSSDAGLKVELPSPSSTTPSLARGVDR